MSRRDGSLRKWGMRCAAAGSVVLVLAAAGCTPDDQETRSLDTEGPRTRAQLPPQLVEALDSGTVAFREHRFEDALAHYQRATELEPEQPSGWFGISMAQEALGNTEAADEAMERVRGLAPGATILRPDTVGEGAGSGGSGESGGGGGMAGGESGGTGGGGSGLP